MTEYFQGLGVEKLTVSKRVDLLERDTRDHSKSLTALMDAQSAMIKRLTELEEAHQQRVIYEVREEQRDIALGLRLLGIEKRLDVISSSAFKLFWLVFSAIVLAGVAFVLSGGLMGKANATASPSAPRLAHPSSLSASRSDPSVP